VSRIELLSELLLFAGGAAMMVVFSSTNSLVQLVVPDEMRGRVMSIYMLAFRGGMTLGALVAGSVAAITSAPLVLVLSGSLLALVAVCALFGSRSLREI
jgi:predicted MFS family arabinose efflux permease